MLLPCLVAFGFKNAHGMNRQQRKIIFDDHSVALAANQDQRITGNDFANLNLASPPNYLKSSNESSLSPFWVLASIFNLALACGLLAMAVLRETPQFWLNAGGYPVWLRALVQIFFYPGLGTSLLLTVGGTTSVFQAWRAGRRVGTGVWMLWLAQVALLVAVLTIMSWNNVHNLFDDEPLHHHDE